MRWVDIYHSCIYRKISLGKLMGGFGAGFGIGLKIGCVGVGLGSLCLGSCCSSLLLRSCGVGFSRVGFGRRGRCGFVGTLSWQSRGWPLSLRLARRA